jgi:hypothetical protein
VNHCTVMNLALKESICPLTDFLKEERKHENRKTLYSFVVFFFLTGDWHCAYVLLYGPRILELPEGQNVQPNAVEDVTAQSPMETSSSSPKH